MQGNAKPNILNYLFTLADYGGGVAGVRSQSGTARSLGLLRGAEPSFSRIDTPKFPSERHLRVRAAIDREIRAGNVGRLRAGEERDQCCNFVNSAVPL